MFQDIPPSRSEGLAQPRVSGPGGGAAGSAAALAADAAAPPPAARPSFMDLFRLYALAREPEAPLALRRVRGPLTKMLFPSYCRFLVARSGRRVDEYHRLRRLSCLIDRDMRGHFNDGRRDADDATSDQILAVGAGVVLGGVRLTCSTPDARRPLPSEGEAFCFAERLPEYGLERAACGEAHRFVVAPDLRADDRHPYARDLLVRLYARAVERGLDYLLVPATPRRCRLLRRLAASVGMPVEIRRDVVLWSDQYDRVPRYVLVCDLRAHEAWEVVEAMTCDPAERRVLYAVEGAP